MQLAIDKQTIVPQIKKGFIYRNKELCVYAVLIFIQFLLLFGMWVLSIWIRNKCAEIKYLLKDTQLVTKIPTWWECIYESGKVSHINRTVSQVVNNQHAGNVVNLVANFFNGLVVDSSVDPTKTPITLEVAKFEKLIWLINLFNAYVQISVFFFASFVMLFMPIGYLLIKNIGHAFYQNLRHHFYKTLVITLFNVFGLWYFQIYEDNIYENKNYTKLALPLYRKSKLKMFITLWGSRHNLLECDGSSCLIEVRDLNFSYQTKHNIFKHWLDHWRQYRTREQFNEEQHFFSFADFFGFKPSRQILKSLNFKIKPNTINVLIGPNGCGKSTLLKILLNLNKNYTGQVKWCDKLLSDLHWAEIPKNVVYVPQELHIPDGLNMYDFLSFSRLIYEDKNELIYGNHLAILKAIKNSGCFEFEAKNMLELSGGQKQKVILASILAKESKIVFLDEPTTYFDFKNQHTFLKFLKKLQEEENKTIVMILHDIEQAINYATNLIVLKDGEIYAEGDPKEIVTQDLLLDVFNIKCDISKEHGFIELLNITVASKEDLKKDEKYKVCF